MWCWQQHKKKVPQGHQISGSLLDWVYHIMLMNRLTSCNASVVRYHVLGTIISTSPWTVKREKDNVSLNLIMMCWTNCWCILTVFITSLFRNICKYVGVCTVQYSTLTYNKCIYVPPFPRSTIKHVQYVPFVKGIRNNEFEEYLLR